MNTLLTPVTALTRKPVRLGVILLLAASAIAVGIAPLMLPENCF